MMEKSFALEKCIMNYDKIEHEIDTSNLFLELMASFYSDV